MRNKCAGELAPLMHRARVLISLAAESFPEVVLMARASHTPVTIIGKNNLYQDLLDKIHVNRASLDEAVVIQSYPQYELENGLADKEVWKKEIFQKINKTLVSFKKANL